MPNFNASIDNAIEYLKRTVQFHLDRNDEVKAEAQQHMVDGLMEVSEELRRLTNLTTATPANLGDIGDLPPELIAELAGVKADELENQIVTVINSLGGTADIDQVLIGLFRKFSVIQKRKFVQNKLYRMSKSDMIKSVPRRKGVYTTDKGARHQSAPKSKGFESDFDDDYEELLE